MAVTRWTWGWLASLVLLVGLVLTVPANAVGSVDGTRASWSIFGLNELATRKR